MKTLSKYLTVLITCIPLFCLCQVPTSYDSDGDGIPDSVDECMLVKGLPQFHGCPVEKKITATDRDGDGVPDAEDACPDIFGSATNKGCPEIPNGNGSYFGVPSGNGLSASTNLFATTSSSAQADLADFKEKMRLALADAKNGFDDLKGNRYNNQLDTFLTTVCLPGAINCYIIMGNKEKYYADFGTYKEGKLAADKANEVKKRLLMSLGETDWHYSILGKDKYVEESQVWKKTDSDNYPRIRTYVQKRDGLYNVYLTIVQL